MQLICKFTCYSIALPRKFVKLFLLFFHRFSIVFPLHSDRPEEENLFRTKSTKIRKVLAKNLFFRYNITSILAHGPSGLKFKKTEAMELGTFTYEGENFYLNEKPYTVLSGAMHYFRIPAEYWHDRLLKLRECGFNTVETYTSWNLHEPREGEFNFSGNLDIARYIDTAREVGLNVILRPGPYICAEWEFGGLPAWILTYDKMPLRCYDEVFLSKVRRYYKELLAFVRPRLITNGGNVIMLQVENEYGSYGDDKNYLRAIAQIYKENGMDCLYFTSDGPCNAMFVGGTLDEYLCVANFGSKPEQQIGVLRSFRKNQPAMCGEYWCGWFDHWFESHHVRTADEICGDFEQFFKINASMNFYMFHGGTNFGFMNGANYDGKFEPTVTSYDYNALLTEAGDRTESYYRIRSMIAKYFGKEATPELTATETPKAAYGKVRLDKMAGLFENLDRISSPVPVVEPKFMEDIGQSYGYTLYRTAVPGIDGTRRLIIKQVHDRAQIFVDGKYEKTYERWDMPKTKEDCVGMQKPLGETNALDILVENMGRVNYGPKIRDQKGIHDVRFSGYYHFGWEMYPLPMEDLSGLVFQPATEPSIQGPVFLSGSFTIEDTPADTFIRLDGFKKGFVKINGFNLGRYFNLAGPQKTLYVPAPILKKGINEILVFESDETDSLTVGFFDKPDLGSPAEN